MKALFGSLVCLVFTISQTFSQDVGPLFGTGGTTAAITGNYAGVLTAAEFSEEQNSIALFTITIPTTGLGSGNVVIFAKERTYSGTFSGVADPDSAKLVGEINASFSPVSITGTSGSTTITEEIKTYIAAGGLTAQLFQNSNLFSTAKVRMSGSANIQFSNTVNGSNISDGEVTYDVIGFKQSDA